MLHLIYSPAATKTEENEVYPLPAPSFLLQKCHGMWLPHLGAPELPKAVLLPPCVTSLCPDPASSEGSVTSLAALLTASFQWLQEFPSSVPSSADLAPAVLLQMFEEIQQSPVPEAKLLWNIFQLAPRASDGSPSLKLLRMKRAQPKLN